jgi:hypothetical protein
LATVGGASCSTRIMRSSANASSTSGGERSIPPVTASWPRSTAPRVAFGPRARSPRGQAAWARRARGPAHRRV